MTREEAIKIIKECKEKGFKYTFYTVEEYHTALDMAITALEQEPKLLQALEQEKGAYNALVKNIQCSDAISRQAVLESIKNLYPDMPVVDIMGSRRKWLDKYAPYFECENAIEHLPSVNPQPKTGYWILTSDDDCEYCTCSECGYQNGENWMIGSHIKFCQECGAKMVEAQEREDE